MASKLSEEERFDKIFKRIWEDLATLNAKWVIFEQLFGYEDTVKILNDTAPSFFAFTKECYFTDIIISIYRITDKNRNDSLSIKKLLQLSKSRCKDNQYIVLTNEANELHKFVTEKIDPLRNKWIGHRSLDVVLKISTIEFSKVDIPDSIKLMSSLINKFEKSLGRIETSFTHLVLRGDGKSILKLCKEHGELKLNERKRLYRVGQ